MKFTVKFAPSIVALVAFHFLSLYFVCRHEHRLKLASSQSSPAASINTLNVTVTAKHDCHMFDFNK